ncbi:hypothetical protein GBF38_016044, partial [Nibea albiflora]
SVGRKSKVYLGCLSKRQLIIISVAVGLAVLLMIVAAVVITEKPASNPSLSTDGDMLDYLVHLGNISKPDGLYATWYHRANNKEQMNEALRSAAMILEADVTLEGYNTPAMKPIPIMAHPPDVHSDNTLDQWLDAVLASRKAMKLDFKSLESVLYVPPPFPSQTYNRAMMEEMYDMIKDVTQKVSLKKHTQKYHPFSLTLWQGSVHPNVSDLLFVRDNTDPARVYYDIYEPTLSEFKQAVEERGRLRRFYPGGDLMDFLYPTARSSLEVQWFTVTDRTSLLVQLSDGAGGMLVVHVASDSNQRGVPVVEGSGKGSEALTLQDILQQLGQRPGVLWGVHLRIHTQQLLEASLKLLHSAYSTEELYRPVWISMEGLQNTDSAKEFISAVERLFPYVTLVLTEQNQPLIPVTGLSQRVALHLTTASLPKEQKALNSLTEMMDRYDLLVEEDTKSSAGSVTVFKELMTRRARRANTNLYVINPK